MCLTYDCQNDDPFEYDPPGYPDGRSPKQVLPRQDVKAEKRKGFSYRYLIRRRSISEIFGICNASLNSTPLVPKIIPKGQFAGQTFNGLKVGRVFTWREGCSSLPQRAAFSSEAFSRLIQKYRPVGVDFTTSGRGRVGGCVPKRDVPLLTKK